MKKVLVIVDVQNDFVDGALGTKEAVEILPYVKEEISKKYDDVFATFDFFTADNHTSFITHIKCIISIFSALLTIHAICIIEILIKRITCKDVTIHTITLNTMFF